MKHVHSAFLVLTLILLACGAGDAPPAGHCGINKREAAHACVHGRGGPFVAVEAQLNQPMPTVSQLHTLYITSLGVDGQGAFEGHVTFRAGTAGLWAFFLTEHARVTAQTPDGASHDLELSTELVHCTSFRLAHVVRLAKDEAVRLRFSNVAAPTLGLLPERLGQSWQAALETNDCSSHGGSFDGSADASVVQEGGFSDAVAHADATSEGASKDSGTTAAMPPDAAPNATPMCRFDGPCTRDDECCDYCHDGNHCH